MGGEVVIQPTGVVSFGRSGLVVVRDHWTEVGVRWMILNPGRLSAARGVALVHWAVIMEGVRSSAVPTLLRVMVVEASGWRIARSSSWGVGGTPCMTLWRVGHDQLRWSVSMGRRYQMMDVMEAGRSWVQSWIRWVMVAGSVQVSRISRWSGLVEGDSSAMTSTS
ncbi:MAG: hypothetical protein RI897_3396 [Verrucomicrobiota bacterium]